ncbi:MAG: hypothetical protein U5K54_01320 [Cytophagales bacterium]|nr:hypothetical protein [Cytophagales bacterium]
MEFLQNTDVLIKDGKISKVGKNLSDPDQPKWLMALANTCNCRYH